MAVNITPGTDTYNFRKYIIAIVDRLNFYEEDDLAAYATPEELPAGADIIQKLTAARVSGDFSAGLTARRGNPLPIIGTQNSSQNFQVEGWSGGIQLTSGLGDDQAAAQAKFSFFENETESAVETFQLGFQELWVGSLFTQSKITKDTTKITKFFHEMTDNEFMAAVEAMGNGYKANCKSASRADVLVLPDSEAIGMARPILQSGRSRDEHLTKALPVVQVIYTPYAEKSVNGVKNYYLLYNKRSFAAYYTSAVPFGSLYVTKPTVDEARMTSTYGFHSLFVPPTLLDSRQLEAIQFEHAA